MCLYGSVMLLQGIQNQAPGYGKRLFPISFATLPEIAIVGSIVAINHGIALAKFEVITGFPVELLERLGTFSDSRKRKKKKKKKRPRLRSMKKVE